MTQPKNNNEHAALWLISDRGQQEMAGRMAIVAPIIDRKFAEYEAAVKSQAVKDSMMVMPWDIPVSVQGRVGILEIKGPLFRYSGFESWIYDGVGYDVLHEGLAMLLADNSVEQIILSINSPGGQVDGTLEFGDAVFAARSSKPVIAVVSGMGDSGAYWIASQADAIVLSDTSEVGSIGVVISWIDTKPLWQKSGAVIHQFTSTNAPMKRPDYTSPEGKAEMQKTIDQIESVFIGRVSRGRGVDRETIITKFGRGGVRVGQDAVDHQMADALGTLPAVVRSISIRGGAMVTADQLLANHPEAAQELMARGAAAERAKSPTAEQVEAAKKTGHEQGKAEGISEERARIKSIDELEVGKSNEKLSFSAKYETPKTAAELALEIINAQKEQRRVAQEDLAKDANRIPPGAVREDSEGADGGSSEGNPLLKAAERFNKGGVS